MVKYVRIPYYRFLISDFIKTVRLLDKDMIVKNVLSFLKNLVSCVPDIHHAGPSPGSRSSVARREDRLSTTCLKPVASLQDSDVRSFSQEL